VWKMIRHMFALSKLDKRYVPVAHTILVWRAWCLLPANSNMTSVIQIQQTLVNYVKDPSQLCKLGASGN
jgi:hypothetical protein